MNDDRWVIITPVREGITAYVRFVGGPATAQSFDDLIAILRIARKIARKAEARRCDATVAAEYPDGELTRELTPCGQPMPCAKHAKPATEARDGERRG